MSILAAITPIEAPAVIHSALALDASSILTLAEGSYGRFVGRFHPLVIHFPIALLIVAALVELPRLLSARATRPTSFGTIALLFAAIFGCLAAWSGWMNAEFESPDDGTTLFLHRWLGITTAAVAVCLLPCALIARRGGDDESEAEENEGDASVERPQRSKAFLIYRYGLLAAAGLVGFTGHLGGDLVYGEDYVMKAWPSADDVDDESSRSDDTSQSATTATAPESAPPTATAPAVPSAAAPGPGDTDSSSSVFVANVLPIFEARCVECHGPDKAKAGLRLDSLAAIVEAEHEEEDPPLVVPGDPDESELLRRVLLPRDDDDAMPPKGDGLTPAQIEAIRAWIAGMPAA